MKVQPQTIPTPRGCLVGWKAIAADRCPLIVRSYSRRNRYRSFAKYVAGTSYTATTGLYNGRHRFQSKRCFASAVALKEARELDLADALKQRPPFLEEACLPGIHLCHSDVQAHNWAASHGWGITTIIPVAYHSKSIVGKRGDDIIVVYRIKVLG